MESPNRTNKCAAYLKSKPPRDRASRRPLTAMVMQLTPQCFILSLSPVLSPILMGPIKRGCCSVFKEGWPGVPEWQCVGCKTRPGSLPHWALNKKEEPSRYRQALFWCPCLQPLLPVSVCFSFNAFPAISSQRC